MLGATDAYYLKTRTNGNPMEIGYFFITIYPTKTKSTYQKKFLAPELCSVIYP